MNRRKALKYMYVVIMSLLISFIVFVSLKYSTKNEYENLGTEAPVVLEGDWYYYAGDSRKDTMGRYDIIYSESYKWEKYDKKAKLKSGIIWLKVKLPEKVWRDPALFFDKYSYYQIFEVYMSNIRIYKSGEFKSNIDNKFINNMWHIVSLPKMFYGKELLVRIYSDDESKIGINTKGIYIGPYKSLVTKMIKNNFELTLFGVILSMIGGFSLLVIFLNIRDKTFINFGAMTLSFGIYFLLSGNISNIFFISTATKGVLEFGFSYISLIILFMFICILHKIEDKRDVRHILNFYVFFGAFNLFSVIFIKKSYEYMNTVFTGSVIAGIFLAFFFSVKDIKKISKEVRIIGLGTTILAITLFHSTFSNVEPGILHKKNFLPWGIFFFIMILAYVLIRKYENTRRELKEYAVDLEKKVVERSQNIIEAEEKYRNIFENAPVGIFSSNNMVKFMNINYEESKIMGYRNPHEMINEINHIKDIFKNKEDYKIIMEKINGEKKITNYETEFYSKKGELLWLSLSAKLHYDKSGTPVVEGFVTDISERKKLEEDLVILSQAIEHSPYSFAITDIKGIVTYVNPSLCRYFAMSKEEILKKRFAEILKTSNEELNHIFVELVAKGGDWRCDMNIQTENGSKWINIYIYPVKKGSKIINFIVVIEDITNRKTEEEALKKAKLDAETANNVKTEFLANMSHEIRTPMNAIIGFSNLLENIVSGEKEKSYLNAINSSGKNLMMLINDILDLSKIEAGKMKLEYNNVNFKNILFEVKNIFSLKVSEKGIDYIEEIGDNFPNNISLDEVRLRQILFNLVGNAVKFTDKGHVKIKSESKFVNNDSRFADIRISVCDTGIGIKKDSTESIFEAFKQQEGQSNRKYGGTGLGLAITKRLTEMMGGKILLESTEAKGSVFTLEFKNVEVLNSTEEVAGEDFDYHNIEFDEAEILAVDGDERFREFISEIFEKTHIKVSLAENMEEAYKILKKKTPDIILAEVKRNKEEILMFLKNIKSNHTMSKIKILAMTSELFDSKDFDGHIMKPASIKEIMIEISKFLKYTVKSNNEIEANSTEEKNENNISKDIIEEFERLFIPEWNRIKNNNRINDIESFGRKISDFGKMNKVPLIEDLGNSIFISAENFDIDNMTKFLNKVPEVVEIMKNGYSSGITLK